MVMDMELSGKNKIYLRLSFYTILFMLVYVILTFYLYSNNIMLRNKPNILISFIIVALIVFSLFQSVITKFKNSNIKLIIGIVIIFGITGMMAFTNNYIINKYLDKEVVENYNGDNYIVKIIGDDKYYYKVYSDFLKSKYASFSIEEKEIQDGDIKYVYKTVTSYNEKGQISDIKTEGGVGETK